MISARKGSLFAILLFCAITSSGCIYSKAHPMGIEPSAREMEVDNYEILGAAEGISSSFTLLWCIPITPRINYDEAFNEAIRSQGADNLIEVTIWREKKVYAIGTVDVLHVKGKAIRYLAASK